MAPARPMASVPTGIPAGICTIDSRLSWPDSAFDCTGTPSTGRWVSEDTIPGRCAAPPAPATMTLKPSPAAPLANATIRSGVRCAETIRASQATPSLSSTSAAARMVGQSDWLPITMATSAPMSAVLQVMPLARAHLLVEVVDYGLAGGNLEPGDVRIRDARQVLDQRAERIAVGRDDHRLAARQHRQDRGVPVGQHALDRQLEAFGRGNGDPGIARIGGQIVRPAGLEHRRRHVEAAAPHPDLLVAVPGRGLGLVEPGEPAIVPLVEPP